MKEDGGGVHDDRFASCRLSVKGKAGTPMTCNATPAAPNRDLCSAVAVIHHYPTLTVKWTFTAHPSFFFSFDHSFVRLLLFFN
jgi:hypothetical protein